MMLLTRARLYEEIEEIEAPSTALAVVPPRRSLHSTRYDLVVLSPPGLSADITARVVALFSRGGLVTGSCEITPDTSTSPEVPTPVVGMSATDAIARIGDTRAVIILQMERERMDGEWTAWLIGAAAASGVRTARLPIARRDAWKTPQEFRPPAPPVAHHLPYVGIAQAVGEEAETFWWSPLTNR
jgi:hypothetical protein